MIPRRNETPPLSQSIRRGGALLPGRLPHRYIDLDLEASCPLGAAFLGSLPHGIADVQRFYTLVHNSSEESICQFILVGLMKAFPFLGGSVWLTPRLAQYLERERLIPRLGQCYDRAAHPSLYGVVTRLHDDAGWGKDQIAALLARYEL